MHRSSTHTGPATHVNRGVQDLNERHDAVLLKRGEVQPIRHVRVPPPARHHAWVVRPAHGTPRACHVRAQRD
jgi:hypothetical protein